MAVRSEPPGLGGPLVEARPSCSAAEGDFTYTVLVEPQPATGERRGTPRRRTRLRSGKLVDGAGRFVTECLVHDLSARGGRLRLPEGVSIPAAVRLYDDQTGALHVATVLWRQGREIGVALTPAPRDARSLFVAGEMRRKFYAMNGA